MGYYIYFELTYALKLTTTREQCMSAAANTTTILLLKLLESVSQIKSYSDS